MHPVPAAAAGGKPLQQGSALARRSLPCGRGSCTTPPHCAPRAIAAMEQGIHYWVDYFLDRVIERAGAGA